MSYFTAIYNFSLDTYLSKSQLHSKKTLKIKKMSKTFACVFIWWFYWLVFCASIYYIIILFICHLFVFMDVPRVSKTRSSLYVHIFVQALGRYICLNIFKNIERWAIWIIRNLFFCKKLDIFVLRRDIHLPCVLYHLYHGECSNKMKDLISATEF